MGLRVPKRGHLTISGILLVVFWPLAALSVHSLYLIKSHAYLSQIHSLPPLLGSRDVSYAPIVHVLVSHCSSYDRFTRLTAITWLHPLIAHAEAQMLPFCAQVLTAPPMLQPPSFVCARVARASRALSRPFLKMQMRCLHRSRLHTYFLQILDPVLSSLSHPEEEIREAASRADATLRDLIHQVKEHRQTRFCNCTSHPRDLP